MIGTEPLVIVDGFQYVNNDLSQHYFLSHFHSDHYMGLNKKFSSGKIYCSEVTANLVHKILGNF